ncbi:hypothetical protein K491DRAFT_761119 [Lophiostoma macrostomum CBS 122681]|uniref:DUF7918 domain-containing protein n=1 Tax=Lophiostoma macrostomum CBS 122681 TaxID=1314788 RepID=A0A6A6SUB3_9PLEO|nr:hypothetical protein K491DRAFT_761119 [Lophiostoma macrostomum CBS 122681]
MAILPDIPGLRVEVYVNGDPLREYHDYEEDSEDDDEDDEEEPDRPRKTVTKYVEAVSGANFELRVSFNDSFDSPHAIRGKIEIDGMDVRRCAWKTQTSRLTHKHLEGAHITQQGQRYIRKFRFRELDIVEENESTKGQRPNNLRTMGQISMDFYCITNIRTIKPANEKNVDLPEPGQIAEKALKGRALSHCGILDAPQRNNTPSTAYDFDYVDPNKRPFATFVFKYRSLAALKALHVIRRTPSPTPLEERPEEELSQAELLELVRRLKGPTPTRWPTNIKREEGSTRRVKRGREDDGEEESDEEEDDDDDDEDVTFVSKRRKNARRLPREGDMVIEID